MCVVMRFLALEGQAVGKDEEEVQNVLKKGRDANVDLQVSIIN